MSLEWSRSLCLHCGSGVNALDFQLGVNEKYCERELKKGKWYAQSYMKELLQKLTFLQYYGFVFVFHENTKMIFWSSSNSIFWVEWTWIFF